MSSSEARRVLRPKAAARRAYDRMSSVYDWLTTAEAPMRDRLLLLGAVRNGERVLDLGTGTGVALAKLARDVRPHGLVIGLDLSAGMLARARQKILGRMADAVSLIQGDAACLPLPPRSFDAVLMSFTLELIDTPEIPAVLAECKRVLRAEGRLVVGSLASRPRPNAMVRTYEWFHDRFPEWLDCRPIPARSFLTESGFRLERIREERLWGLPVDLIVAGT